MGKSLLLSYILWLTLGWFGVHHFYLKRYRQGFVWWCSLGGCFGLGWLRDLWRLPTYVEDANESQSFMECLTTEMRVGKPKFNIARFCGEIAIGYLFGALGSSFMLEEIMEAHKSLILIAPLFTAIGVHLVGNIGREKVSFTWACAGAYVGLVWLWHDKTSLGAPALLSALAVNILGKSWRRTHQQSSYVKSFFVLAICGAIYLSLWTSVLYHNAHIETEDGERIKLKDAMEHFFNSPAWREMKASFAQLWEHFKAQGFEETMKELSKYLDPEGESYAYEVLGVHEHATEEDINKAYKSLVKQWHPDRVKDPAQKEKASEKFMQIQKAYETLSKIKSRRTSRQHTH